MALLLTTSRFPCHSHAGYTHQRSAPYLSYYGDSRTEYVAKCICSICTGTGSARRWPNRALPQPGYYRRPISLSGNFPGRFLPPDLAPVIRLSSAVDTSPLRESLRLLQMDSNWSVRLVWCCEDKSYTTLVVFCRLNGLRDHIDRMHNSTTSIQFDLHTTAPNQYSYAIRRDNNLSLDRRALPANNASGRDRFVGISIHGLVLA